MEAKACFNCNKITYIKVEPEYVGFSATCTNCLDGDCDQDGYFNTFPVAYGMTKEEAMVDWNNIVDDNTNEEN